MCMAKPIRRCWGGDPRGRHGGRPASALFGQACFSAGLAKNTYGTGCFMLMHTGDKFRHQPERAHHHQRGPGRRTAAVRAGGQRVHRRRGGAWLRDGLHAIKASGEVQALAESVPDAGGVMFVPAFTGLGAPYWNAHARGTLTGLTRGTTMGHIRPRRAGEHRLPERGAAAGDEPRRAGRRRRAGGRVAGGRRCLASTTC